MKRGRLLLAAAAIGTVVLVVAISCCITIEAAPAPAEWPDRDKYPASFVLDELRCIYCGMCEEACPVDAIELTHIYDMTGTTREELVYTKDKLLQVFDETCHHPKDPVRTHRGRLGPASDFQALPPLAPATSVETSDRAAQAASPGTIAPVTSAEPGSQS